MNEHHIVKLVDVIRESEIDFRTASIGEEDGVIGRPEICNKLEFYIQSHSEATPFPTMLLTGSQGLGKTYISRKVADALGRRLVEVNCAALNEDNFFEEFLLGQVMGEQPVTILFDEAHKLNSKVVPLLLSLLAPNSDNYNDISYRSFKIRYDFVNINAIFATTEAYMIFKPLRNRCRPIYFNLYDDESLFSILKFYLKDIVIDVSASTQSIADACRGRARDTYNLSQEIERYCVINSTKIFTDDGWRSLSHTLGIHNKGLHSQEVQLMEILRDRGPVSCKDLAIMMGVNERNVEEELEVRPKELGLVESTSKGRNLTTDGVKYLKTL